MKLTVAASELDLVFMAMTNGALPGKIKYGSETQEVDENGNPLFTGKGLQCLRLDEDGVPNGADKTVSLTLRQPANISFGKLYRLSGKVDVIHYLSKNNRIAVSLKADSIKPHEPAPSNRPAVGTPSNNSGSKSEA
ncbi:hypothetical protein ACUH88_07810 [Dermabacteraceae bacterium P13095]